MNPIELTQTALGPKGGKVLFAAVVAAVALQAGGCVDFTPNPTASQRPGVDCAEHAEYHRTSTTVVGQRVPCPQP